MSLLNPTEAPTAHVEMLPPSSIAVEVVTGEATGLTGSKSRVHIKTWAPGDSLMEGDGSEGDDPDDWVENNCHSCRYHEEEIEHQSNGETVQTGDGELEIRGIYYTQSPCPCYEEGVSAVSFPCEEGLDGPEESEEDYTELDTAYLTYTVALTMYDYGCAYAVNHFVRQQACRVDDDNVYVGRAGTAVNTYTGDHHVCWGDNEPGNSLLEVQLNYIDSEANEDLCSFSTHQGDAQYCKTSSVDERRPNAIPTPDSPDGLGKAVAVASPRTHPSAFMLMATNGIPVRNGFTTAFVYLYPQVAVSDDVILNVYATDILPTGNRLLFHTVVDPDDGIFTQLLGAVDQDFNLQSCKSHPVQSSAQAELVNS